MKIIVAKQSFWHASDELKLGKDYLYGNYRESSGRRSIKYGNSIKIEYKYIEQYHYILSEFIGKSGQDRCHVFGELKRISESCGIVNGFLNYE